MGLGSRCCIASAFLWYITPDLRASGSMAEPPPLPRYTTPRNIKASPIDYDSLPPNIASAIRERPWRAGLEPAEDVDIIRIPAENIEGRLPPDLVGTFFRNGPGRIRVGNKCYGHWFDGDGLITATTFGTDGSVYFRQRYLRTSKFKAQCRAGEHRLGARGVWTQRENRRGGPGGWLHNLLRVPANPVNTNVLVVGGKVLALCEGGPPFVLDPVSLEVGPAHTFDGRLRSFFSAHPKVDPDTGVIYNQGLSLGLTTALHFMKISPEGKMLKQVSMKLGELFAVHDSLLAGPYFIVFVCPYLSPYPAMAMSLLGAHALGSTYSWEPSRGTRVLIFDKESLSLVRELTIPAVSMYHFINGWERQDGAVEIVLAKHRSERANVERGFTNMYTAHFTQDTESEAWRYVIDVNGGQLLTAEPLSEAEGSPGFELPTVNPLRMGKRTRYAYVNSLCRDEGLVDSISKLHLDEGGRFESHTWAPDVFAGEAVFVPRARADGIAETAEDDGYLLTYCFDARRGLSDLVILDAKAPAKPPVCVVHLPVHVPYGFHGTFTGETYGLGGR